jgi:predicted HTH transcriptional regulator
MNALQRASIEKAGHGEVDLGVLSKRQILILEQTIKEGKVTTGWVISSQKVVKDTAVRDLKGLCELGLLNKIGSGRGVHYVPKNGQ